MSSGDGSLLGLTARRRRWLWLALACAVASWGWLLALEAVWPALASGIWGASTTVRWIIYCVVFAGGFFLSLLVLSWQGGRRAAAEQPQQLLRWEDADEYADDDGLDELEDGPEPMPWRR